MFEPTITRIKNNLTTGPELGYIIDEAKCVILEAEAHKAEVFAKTFKKDFSKELPYLKYGFEDCYEFINAWQFFDIEGRLIKYNSSFAEEQYV